LIFSSVFTAIEIVVRRMSMTTITIGKVPKGIQYAYRISNRTRTPVQSGLGVYRQDLDADVRTRLRSRA